MDLSLRWLRDYLELETTPQEFAHRMTMSGSKVEGFAVEGAEIDKVVIGRVLSIDKHPGADTLLICKVDVGGKRPLQVITGAHNLKNGDVVPVALDGAALPGGKRIKAGKLRGELSEGMLCSIGELGLTEHDFPGNDDEGIMVISDRCDLGADARAALGIDDTVVEFEITPNRPDCLSVLGLAREAAVTYGTALRVPPPEVKNAAGDITELLSVEVRDSDLCPRYIAAAVQNAVIAPSPRWIRERLRASGIRPINNIVDITNYVMLEYGQPLHAFDLSYVAGNAIVVRRAAPGETITTLDGEVRALEPDMLVIADRDKPSAVAGIMGGEHSGIGEGTRTIIFEAANFNGPSIRRTAKKLGMRTESSGRFEKGLSPYLPREAMLRALQLVEQLGAGEVVGGLIDVAPALPELPRIELDPAWICRFLGADVGEGFMRETLSALGFTLEGDAVTPPPYRIDVSTKYDLAEEVARFFGYNSIPSTLPRTNTRAEADPRQQFVSELGAVARACGYNEIITFSFFAPQAFDLIRLPQDSPLRDAIKLQNPIGEETSTMRTTTLPAMLETLGRNYAARNADVKLYDLGVEYHPRGAGELPDERQQLTMGAYGEGADFFAVKGAVERILCAFGVAGAEFPALADAPTFHPGRTALITVAGERCGVIGEVHPEVAENYGIADRAVIAKLDVDVLYRNRLVDRHYLPLPRFPATARDLALVCDAALPVGDIEKAIRRGAGALLESLRLFDIYQGAQVEPGKKSVAYALALRDRARTLSDKDADRCVADVLLELSKIGVLLRQ